jgi:hypothetical protein
MRAERLRVGIQLLDIKEAGLHREPRPIFGVDDTALARTLTPADRHLRKPAYKPNATSAAANGTHSKRSSPPSHPADVPPTSTPC